MAIYPLLFLIMNMGYDWFTKPVWMYRAMLKNMPGGLNRYFLGLYSLAIISLCLSIFTKKQRHVTTSLFILLMIPIISGSRQFLVVLFVSFSMLLVVGNVAILRLLLLSKQGLSYAFVLLGGLTYLFFSGYLNQSLGRLVANQHASLDDQSAQTRFDIYKTGMEYFAMRPLGHGPGTAEDMVGMATHSSYVHIMLEYGVLGAFIFLVLGIVVSVRIFRSSTRARRFLFPLFVPYYFLFPLFTDVAYMLIYWVVSSVFLGISMNKNAIVVELYRKDKTASATVSQMLLRP